MIQRIDQNLSLHHKHVAEISENSFRNLPRIHSKSNLFTKENAQTL